jgi:alpha-D-xyloside xylohydrolase
VEDEYLFGSQMLVAPLMESGTERTVYLPAGKWIDYQSGKVYDGGYHTIAVGPIPAVILVRDGSIIPHAKLAQRTDQIDWSDIELRPYRAQPGTPCRGLLFKPGDSQLQTVQQ